MKNKKETIHNKILNLFDAPENKIVITYKDIHIRIDNDSDIFWYKNGILHREDGPAILYKNGNRYWYKNHKYHNETGPAIIYADGTKRWYKNGELHNENGPAIVWPDGTKYWHLNNQIYTEHKWKKQIEKQKRLRR